MIGAGLGLVLLLAGSASEPPDIPAVALEGLETAVADQLREARAQLEQARAEGQADAARFGKLGQLYQAYGLVPAAEACYREAERLDPADYRWPYLLALLALDDSRLADAVAAFERTLQRPDKYYPAFVRLAGAYLTQGRLDAAAAILEPAERHAPGDPALLAVQGELALAQGHAEEALRMLTQALEAQPRATRLHYSLGMACRALGRLDEARRHLGQAGTIGVRPRDPLWDQVQDLRLGERSYMIEGHVAYRARDYESAAAAYRRAADASGGTSVGPLVNLAAAETQLGQLEPALEHLRRAQRLEPRDAGVLYNLGVLLAHAGRAPEAEPVLRELVGRAPRDDAARVAWALVLLEIGRLEQGLDELGRTRQVERESCPVALARLAAVAAGPDPALAARARLLEQRLSSGSCMPNP